MSLKCIALILNRYIYFSFFYIIINKMKQQATENEEKYFLEKTVTLAPRF